MARLVVEERRFVLEAQLEWIEFARQELAARAERTEAPDADADPERPAAAAADG